MVVESFPEFLTWLPNAGLIFLLVLVIGAVLGTLAGYLIATFRHGPFEAFYVVAQVIAGAIPDFLRTSPRRVLAIARLSIKEAMRRRIVLATFAVFAFALLFGGWFLNSGAENADRLYLNFVLWGTQMLVLLMGVLISSFSLPEDIKNRTIYTVVTKPVRATEIVIGRMVGFGLLGTALLGLMGLISFVFVWRGLSHTHQIVGDTQTVAALSPIDTATGLNAKGQRASDTAIKSGETVFESGHQHTIELIQDVREPGSEPINPANVLRSYQRNDGKIVYERVICNPAFGHTHEVQLVGEGDDKRIVLGPAAGYFRARVPLYANSLIFYDGQGELKERGIDVGTEWRYRGYVDGGTYLSPASLSRAIFEFQGLTPDQFDDPNRLNLEMTLGVFRTFVGNIQKRVMASIQFESVPANPELEDRIVSDTRIFETQEFQVQTQTIPRKIRGQRINPNGTVVETREFDLFDDFVKGTGKLRLILRCEDKNQYIGVSRADIYFRGKDDLFGTNFLKGYIGIWIQMLIIIAMGVAFSTFLSAPITILMVCVAILVGFSSDFIRGLLAPDAVGGGPIESFYRVITQKNMEAGVEAGMVTTLMQQTDKLLLNSMNLLTNLAPDFSRLNFAEFLTYGYSIDGDRVLVAMSICLAFCCGLAVLGYFCLKTREIAK